VPVEDDILHQKLLVLQNFIEALIFYKLFKLRHGCIVNASVCTLNLGILRFYYCLRVCSIFYVGEVSSRK